MINTTHNPASESELAKARELLQGQANVFATCAKHQYVPKKMGIEGNSLTPPRKACADCWRAWYLTLFAMLPPHIREERLEAMEEAAAHTVEAARRGETIEWLRKPEISIERESDSN